MCGVMKRVGDHIKSHILTHSKDMSLYMSRSCIEHSVNNRIPIMYNITTKDKKNVKGNYAMCLVCKQSRYCGGKGNISDFYVSHRNSECRSKWDSVESLFTNALTSTETVPVSNVVDERSRRTNRIKKLLSEIKSKIVELEDKIRTEDVEPIC